MVHPPPDVGASARQSSRALARHAGDAGGGRGEDRRGTQEGSERTAAPAAVTSRREAEALLLDELHADRDDLSVELDPGVRADLGEGGLHAEGGAVGAV